MTAAVPSVRLGSDLEAHTCCTDPSCLKARRATTRRAFRSHTPRLVMLVFLKMVCGHVQQLMGSSWTQPCGAEMSFPLTQ